MLEKQITNKKTTHAFHVLDPSPWPFLSGIGALAVTTGGVLYMHMYSNGMALLNFGLIFATFIMVSWLLDIINESTFGGFHTKAVQKGLKIGFILFLVSEIMFFASFFWAFFHSSLNPVITIGNVWPPKGIEALSPYTIALLNTAILLTSGATVTWAHYSILNDNREEAIMGLSATIGLGLFFTWVQSIEYKTAAISINDSVFGSLLYLMTGFHGAHVILGTLFLIACLIRLVFYHFTKEHHLGFEFASWYWHFVDIVWIFLYICVYWWSWPGSNVAL
jgi:cytochrome c oxidase subunit 3